MKVVFDIETDKLVNPTKIWVIVCKDIQTGVYYVYRPETHPEEKESFLTYAQSVELWVGHNILNFDLPVLINLINAPISYRNCYDTLILSRLIDYPRESHSIESYGIEFDFPKIDFKDFSKYTEEMLTYCQRDVDITHKVYNKYLKYINNPSHKSSIELEHDFQYLIINALENNGFAFNKDKAQKLLDKVTKVLEELDGSILHSFPPKDKLIKEFIPKATKFGTISKSSVPRSLHHRIHEFRVGESYRHTRVEHFNPASHKQVVDVLVEAGWKPVSKTVTHIALERELSSLRRSHQDTTEVENKLKKLATYGYKINEENLSTLPDTAPEPARLLAKRILYESRRRSLTEWLSLVADDGRIHGSFQSIGAWTHRMSHQKPNTANIPREFTETGSVKLLGKEMRQLWRADKKRLLVGVDAEGIQLRIFAHYINDPAFTKALVEGRKEDKTDAHCLNQSVLGEVCQTRQAAKRFIYALLLGAGIGKLAEVLSCDKGQAQEALGRLLERYRGLSHLKETIIPADARRGWFTGIDGRKVRILGDTTSERKHLCMSGYLQNGEAVIIKKTAVIADPLLKRLDKRIIFVDIVHDEYVIECPNDIYLAEEVKKILCQCIKEAGEAYKLNCPLAGDGSIGLNWYDIH